MVISEGVVPGMVDGLQPLTDRQQEILSYIEESIGEKGYPPTVREIGRAVGLRSPSTVHSHLASLEELGYIRRDPAKGRAIDVIYGGQPKSEPAVGDALNAPLVGRVTAGEPILATENVESVVPLPRELIRHASDEVFILRVEGNSMVDAGIFDGDYVVVKRQQTADNGDIVVALLDDEATVKRFFRETEYIRLQPENETMSPILTRDAKVLGVVVGLLRSLR